MYLDQLAVVLKEILKNLDTVFWSSSTVTVSSIGS